MRVFIRSILILLGMVVCPALAVTSQQPLPAEQAFVLSASLFGKDTVLLKWQMAPQHYLYQERFVFKVVAPANATVGSILYPPGQPKEDKVLGNYHIYDQQLTIPVPIINPDPTSTVLQITYQGCSEDGYCYPPTTVNANINFSAGSVALTKTVTAKPVVNQQDRFLQLLNSQRIFTIFFAFIGFGILLSFTPCVLPMLPIISGIIIGQRQQVTTAKAFRLSAVYVVSMAITYAIAGILVGYLGSSVQTAFQKPWILILFSLLFVFLALSFFGLYEIRMPARLEERIAKWSRHQKSGHYIGVAIMGCLATLIVSPCITPALVGVLGYIGRTGDAVLGGVALFALGIGMGLPIIIVCMAGGKLLPKAGRWMRTVETVFGVFFLAMAIWILSRILPGPITLLLWSALFIISAIYMGALSTTPEHGWGKLWKGCGWLFFIYGVLLLVGAAQGANNPLQPLTTHKFISSSAQPSQPLFTQVNTLDAVQQAITNAKNQKKPVLLDFYADWCVSCQEMEHGLWQDANVRQQLGKVVALQANITANDAQDKTLMANFKIIAPPTVLFFNAQGQWLSTLTLVGKPSTEEFLAHLSAAAKG